MPAPGHLVSATTADELILHAFFVPSSPDRPAVMLVHGLTANFYRLPYVHTLAEALHRAGYAFLTVNTRGHDIMATVYSTDPDRSARVGSAYERFEHSLLDLRAWLDWLEERSFSRVVLLGHSLGAAKAAFYAARTGDPRLAAVGLLSPADLTVVRRQEGEAFEEVVAWAQEQVAAGRPTALFVPPTPEYTPMSAATILDLFGPDAPAHIFRFSAPDQPWPCVPDIAVPLLALLGTEGEYVAGAPQDALDALVRQARRAPSCTARLLPGVRHNYRGHETLVTSVILTWLEDTLAGARGRSHA